MKMRLDTEVSTKLQARIRTLVNRRGSWNGSMTELNEVLTSGTYKTTPENWPTSPATLRRAVNTVVSSLRKVGIRTTFTRTTDHFRKRVVQFERV